MNDFNPIPRKWSVILWIIILLFLFIGIFSCSPSKRLQRFQKNHPYLFKAQMDTVKVNDTIHFVDTVHVTVPGIKIDTLVAVDELKDTIFIKKENLNVKAWTFHDTLYLQGETDTVYINVPHEVKVPYEVKVPVNRFITPPPKEKTIFQKIQTGVFVLALIFLLGWIAYKLVKAFKG